MTRTCFFLCSLALLVSCSGDGDPQGVDAGDIVEQCAPTPTRMVVLGDSIAACVGVQGKNAATCGPKAFHASLSAGYAPGIAYDNQSVSGAVTTGVVDSQLATVTTGPGHVLVLIYVGGNDLQQYLLQPDAAAQAGLRGDLPGIADDWRSVFSFFNDISKFPDGATIIMNNQYNPFDDCTAPPYNLSAIKAALLSEYNVALEGLAAEQENVTITDQYTSYLGHGHHYNVASCPHYQPGLEPFMEDLIHPNAAGHANLAAQWALAADDLYGSCE